MSKSSDYHITSQEENNRDIEEYFPQGSINGSKTLNTPSSYGSAGLPHSARLEPIGAHEEGIYDPFQYEAFRDELIARRKDAMEGFFDKQLDQSWEVDR